MFTKSRNEMTEEEAAGGEIPAAEEPEREKGHVGDSRERGQRTDGADSADPGPADSKAQEPEDPLAVLKTQCAELNDRYLRLYSEFDNFRKRTSRERIELIRSAGEDVFTALLPVMDDLERAIRALDDAKDIGAVRQGVKLIHSKLKAALESKGLKAMEAVGREFDVDKHEAISNVPVPGKKMKGKVVEEVEKGYYLNDKVIRYAKVIIGN